MDAAQHAAKGKGKGKTGKDRDYQQNTPAALTMREYLPEAQIKELWADQHDEEDDEEAGRSAST